MERSQSVPLKGPGMLQPLQPFYSERLQRELQLEALRPKELPSPGDEAMPVRDAGLADGSSGKGRGGMAESSVGRFATPNGQPQTMGHVGPQGAMQSQGVMPSETVETRQTMGPMHGHVKNVKNVEGEKVDALQRGLEVELVDFLRQQNSQLMEEMANLKSKLESKV